MLYNFYFILEVPKITLDLISINISSYSFIVNSNIIGEFGWRSGICQTDGQANQRLEQRKTGSGLTNLDKHINAPRIKQTMET